MAPDSLIPPERKKKGRFLMLLRTRFAAVWTQLSSYRIWDGSHGLFSEDLWAILRLICSGFSASFAVFLDDYLVALLDRCVAGNPDAFWSSVLTDELCVSYLSAVYLLPEDFLDVLHQL